MKRRFNILLALALGAGVGVVSANVEVDELDLVEKFGAPRQIALPGELNWKLPKEAVRTGNRIVVDIPANAKPGTAMATAPIDLSAYSGKMVEVRMNTEMRRVTKLETSYFGFKFQLCVTYADGSKEWPACRFGGVGDRACSNVVSFTLQSKPIRSTKLEIGLQGATGWTAFDLATLSVWDCGRPFLRVNRGYRAPYTDDVLKAPRRRGVMLAGRAREITEDHFATLGKWGATLARFQLSQGWHTVGAWLDLTEYDRYVDGELDILEQKVLPWADKYGVKICLDMHAAPGARVGSRKELRMCYEKKYADHFVATWRRIARRFKGDRRIYGFDLVNEPCQYGAAPFSYLHLQLAAARAIREIDPHTPIVIESNDYDSARTFEYLSPLKLTNIIYQVHCYVPMGFTHQGVFDKSTKGKVAYPNAEKGWNKDFIRKSLEVVRRFELEHGAKIYVGEFSAATWAPGAENFIRDEIEIFEEYGWDWSYNAFRESKIWSVEHNWSRDEKGRDVYRPSASNPRMEVLKRAFRADGGVRQ